MKNRNHVNRSVDMIEDRAMKGAFLYIGTDLLPFLGVPGRVRRIAPTELVYLELKDFLMDFNFEMEDGTWKHFEFESDAITEKDLKRFRVYEAYASYCYDVEITTYVLCSAKTKVLKHELKQGFNCYRIQVIRLKNDDADEIIEGLEQIQKVRPIEKVELVKLLLTPLMDGKMPVRERIRRALQLLQKAESTMDLEEVKRMTSVLYAFAVKFIDDADESEWKEMFGMTHFLKDMLRETIEQGLNQGISQGIEAMILDNLEEHKNRDQILEKLVRRFSVTMEEAENHYNRVVGMDHQDGI